MTIHAPQRRVDQIEPHPGEPDRNHRNVRNQTRKGPSCAACRQSKQRCDGAVPCHRCERHSRPCHYPPRRSRQVRSHPPHGPRALLIHTVQRKPAHRTGPQKQPDGSVSVAFPGVDVDVAASAQAVRRSEGIHSTMERAQDLDLVCSTRNDDFIMTDGVLGGSSLSPIPGFSDYATNERPSLSFRFDYSWLWLWQGIDSQDESLAPSHSQVPMSQSGSGRHDARGRQDAINAGTQSLASHQPCTATSVDYLGFQTPASRSPLIVSDNTTVNTGQETHPIPRGSNSRSTMPPSPSVGLDQLKGTDSHREAPDVEAHADACGTDDDHSHVSLNDGVSDDYFNPGSGAHSPAKALSRKAYNDLCLWVNTLWMTDARLSGPSPGYKSLPDRYSMNSFLRLYLEKFHELLPIIYKPTFDPNSAPILLVLAMACIGSHYSDIPEAAAFAKEVVAVLGGVISRMVGPSSLANDRW